MRWMAVCCGVLFIAVAGCAHVPAADDALAASIANPARSAADRERDGRDQVQAVLAFAGLVTVLTTVVCGLAPAIGATGGALVNALRDGAPSVSGSRRTRMLRQAFVTVEIALALTVLCGAGVLGRSVMALQNVDPGFNAESALTLRVTLPQRSYADSTAQHLFYTRVFDGLAALPEVTSVGGTSFLPLAG